MNNLFQFYKIGDWMKHRTWKNYSSKAGPRSFEIREMGSANRSPSINRWFKINYILTDVPLNLPFHTWMSPFTTITKSKDNEMILKRWNEFKTKNNLAFIWCYDSKQCNWIEVRYFSIYHSGVSNMIQNVAT